MRPFDLALEKYLRAGAIRLRVGLDKGIRRERAADCKGTDEVLIHAILREQMDTLLARVYAIIGYHDCCHVFIISGVHWAMFVIVYSSVSLLRPTQKINNTHPCKSQTSRKVTFHYGACNLKEVIRPALHRSSDFREDSWQRKSHLWKQPPGWQPLIGPSYIWKWFICIQQVWLIHSCLQTSPWLDQILRCVPVITEPHQLHNGTKFVHARWDVSMGGCFLCLVGVLPFRRFTLLFQTI